MWLVTVIVDGQALDRNSLKAHNRTVLLRYPEHQTMLGSKEEPNKYSVLKNKISSVGTEEETEAQREQVIGPRSQDFGQPLLAPKSSQIAQCISQVNLPF